MYLLYVNMCLPVYQPSTQLKPKQLGYENQRTANGIHKYHFLKPFLKIAASDVCVLYNTFHKKKVFAGIAEQQQSKCSGGLYGNAEDDFSHYRGLHVTSGEWH